MRKTLALYVIAVMLTAANAFAGAEARLNGKIKDQVTKAPIADAVITLDALENKTVHQTTKTKKDGSYALFVLDGTVRYKLTVSAPGYTSYDEELKLQLGQPNYRDVQLLKAGATLAAPAAPGGKAPAPDPAVIAYNAGAELSNAGKTAEAIAKFEAAVAAKPAFTPAWIALAKVNLKQKKYDKAIEAAKKVLEIDDEDEQMYLVLAQAYTATGDKAKAAEAQKRAPANPGQLFNEAAALLNKNDDAAAEPLLKRALDADEKMAAAHYELGMIYVRAGKVAEAKQHLNTYLQLEPKGKDAATAKEMLAYMK